MPLKVASVSSLLFAVTVFDVGINRRSLNI